MKRTLIDQSVSDRVLTVGECYWAPVYGGIVSVIKSYRDCFETFPFIASSGQPISIKSFGIVRELFFVSVSMPITRPGS